MSGDLWAIIALFVLLGGGAFWMFRLGKHLTRREAEAQALLERLKSYEAAHGILSRHLERLVADREGLDGLRKALESGDLGPILDRLGIVLAPGVARPGVQPAETGPGPGAAGTPGSGLPVKPSGPPERTFGQVVSKG